VERSSRRWYVEVREDAITQTLGHPTIELLTWISRRPRTYPETIEAWRTHCPRLAVWEDALSAGLVQIVRKEVTLTKRGSAALGSQNPGP
jgi:hypothetical protein